jgi:hypothetical protein
MKLCLVTCNQSCVCHIILFEEETAVSRSNWVCNGKVEVRSPARIFLFAIVPGRFSVTADSYSGYKGHSFSTEATTE